MARLIAGILYGNDALIARHASHLCGNASCLSPAHIYLEPADDNWARDECHKFGFVGEECAHVPKCLQCEQSSRSLFYQSSIVFSAQIQKRRNKRECKKRPDHVSCILSSLQPLIVLFQLFDKI